ncbi:MAG: dual specificity protein phosphatase family protein [Dehalococcoidia bacterium]|nr:dual specificity protein phosphatase family protein [Dehalococcoidia bacterium]
MATHEREITSTRWAPPGWRAFWRFVRTKRGARVLALSLVLAGALTWWFAAGKRMFFPRNWGTVEDHLIYRSGQLHPFLVERVLREHGIRVIVDLDHNPPDDPEEQAEREAAEQLGIRKIDIDHLDGDGLGPVEDYEAALVALREARLAEQPVLVHCAAGASRTGGVVACYRMLFDGWTGPRAFEEYMDYRAHAPHNTKLQDYVNEHLAEIARYLSAKGLLEHVPAPLPRFAP